MKSVLLLLLMMIVGGCAAKSYQPTREPLEIGGERLMTGDVKYDDIIYHFEKWRLADAAAEVKPDQIAALQAIADDIDVVCFLGTWCSDSRDGVPPFVHALRAARNPRLNISLYAVDRDKSDPDQRGPQNGIERVPTFIVSQGDMELGRMVEFPTAENFVADLLRIVAERDKKN